MRLRVLSAREASIFACVCDTVVAPEPLLPPVRETDAVQAFDRLLAASPRVNRAALRALLYVLEISPRAAGSARLRRLSQRERAGLLAAVEDRPRLRQLATLMKSLACLSYYGDAAVMRRLGHDADAVIGRGRALRIADGRP